MAPVSLFCSERAPRCVGGAGAVRRTWRGASGAGLPPRGWAYTDSTRAGSALRDRKVRFESLWFLDRMHHAPGTSAPTTTPVAAGVPVLGAGGSDGCADWSVVSA